ncbi:MAG: hypothetical protein LUI10_03410 [Lachnospiraceae bacterium]|nr:hypothetical protein [Lachnospiraceae bacterium]
MDADKLAGRFLDADDLSGLLFGRRQVAGLFFGTDNLPGCIWAKKIPAAAENACSAAQVSVDSGQKKL